MHNARYQSVLYNQAMLLCDTSVEVNASRAAAWEKLIDWQHMAEWDIFMDSVTFPGPLALGSKGRLKIKGGPEVDLIVTGYDAPNMYTDEFQLLKSRFIFHHYVQSGSTANTVNVRVRIEAQGLFASILAPVMKADIKKKMPKLLDKFKTQIEAK